MKRKTSLMLFLSLAVSGWAVAGDINKPEVSALYQDSFQAAWNKAGEAELPVYECARVVGTATKMLAESSSVKGEAQHAYKACYVDAVLNYTNAFFKLRDNSSIGDNNKPNGCPLYARYLTAHVVSLEASAERFGFSAHDLNQEINKRLEVPASLCHVELN